MQKTAKFLSLLVFTFSLANLNASEEDRTAQETLKEVRNMMKNIIVDNEGFQSDPSHSEEYFRKQSSGQHPRTTIIACADSRVHTSNFDLHPLSDVFFIRNIGNQIETCLGSIDYGVRHLNTPLLLFLGHSECGAIKAATQGTAGLEESIRKELCSMHLTHHSQSPTPQQIAENVAENVHNQVNKACSIYADLISKELLFVVGAVYDFTPEGRGKLTVIQVNDRTDQRKLTQFLEDVQEYGDYYNDPGRE